MSDVIEKNASPEDPYKAAQLQKLELEIENLKKEKTWPKRVALFIPLITVLIAVGGFSFGIYQYVSERRNERLSREKEQNLKIQGQIRSNVEQILTFPEDEKQTISKVSFLLEDLREHLELSAVGSPSDPSRNDMRQHSFSFVKSIVDDCNFDRPRDINYARTLFAQWWDIGLYLQEETNSLEYILSKLTEAQRKFYQKDPEIVMSVRYLRDQNSFSYPKHYGKFNTAELLHFQSIVGCFGEFLEYLKDEKAKDKHLIRFQGAMCNGAFMEQYFGKAFLPQEFPEEFLQCPKR